MGREVLILREAEIRSALEMRACIDAMARAFAAYSSGGAELPGVIQLDVPEREGEIHIKAGYLHGARHYAAKFASGFPRNAELGLPTSDGMLVVFDAETGAPAAFLLDNGFITDLRTGAAGGAAARYLAPEHVERIGVVGTGAQARHQMDALAMVCPRFTEARVWGRNPDHARACVEDLCEREGLPEGCRFETAETVEEAVDGAQVVITCTAGREPLVRAEWLAPGAHVTALGSDGSGKQELEPEVLASADLLVADSREQCEQIGELQHAIGTGLVSREDVVELGEIAAGKRPGRTSASELTVCDLTGVGVQDVAAAELVMRRAAAEGLGETISL